MRGKSTPSLMLKIAGQKCLCLRIKDPNLSLYGLAKTGQGPAWALRPQRAARSWSLLVRQSSPESKPPPSTASKPPSAAGLGSGAPLTLSSEVPADKGSVHILQQDDALLRRHAQEVIEPVIGEAAVAEAQQADTVLQLPGQGCAGKDTNHRGESQRESPEQRKNQSSLPSSRGEGRGILPQRGTDTGGRWESLLSPLVPCSAVQSKGAKGSSP